jgi:hypothetical protein
MARSFVSVTIMSHPPAHASTRGRSAGARVAARAALPIVRDDFEGRYPVRERFDRPLWQWRFLRRPDVDGWVVWQLHGYARVEGIAGGVDLNVMRAGQDDRTEGTSLEREDGFSGRLLFDVVQQGSKDEQVQVGHGGPPE